MIVNDWPGRCGCGKYVQPREGYVHRRKIVCAEHGEMAEEADFFARENLDPYDDPIHGWDDWK